VFHNLLVPGEDANHPGDVAIYIFKRMVSDSMKRFQENVRPDAGLPGDL
jgi:hypothetical protein